MDGWDNFFVAMAGAAVAFAGLVLVSISINLDRIIKQPGLIGRAAEPLAVLFTLFVAASIILIPDQRTAFYGLELILVAVTFGAFIFWIMRAQRVVAITAEREGLSPPHSYRMRALICSAIILLLASAGLLLVFGHEDGAYFTVPAMILGFFLAFMEAWVLLVEIDR